MNRLPLHTIDIPSKPAFDAAGITISTLKAYGIHPGKALANPMMRELCQQWATGGLTDAEFKRCCGNMLILNPGLML